MDWGLVGVGVAGIAGVGVGYWLRGVVEKGAREGVELERLRVQREGLEHRLEEVNSRLEERERELRELLRERGELEGRVAQLEREREGLHRQLEGLGEQLRQELRQLGEQIVAEGFREGEKGVGKVLEPFIQQLERFQQGLEQLRETEMRLLGGVESRLREVVELNSRLSEEANRLTQLLTKSPTQKGAFGELMLARVLELSGIPEGKGYQLQVQLKGGQQEYRVDAVVYLPGGRRVLIDSKFPMAYYQRYLEAATPREREQQLKELYSRVKRIVDEMAGKGYQHLLPGSPDLLLLFIPVEGLYQLIVQSRELVEYALQRRVLFTSPMTLLPALLSLEQLWRLEGQLERYRQLEQVVEKIYKEGRLLGEKLEKVGKGLEQAQKGYWDAIGRLGPGRRKNLFQLLEELRRELGLTPGKRIPESLWKEE